MFNNDTVNYSPQRLATSYPWLNTSIFLVESESLMYCSVPKVASKTFISVITYVYIRSIINQVNYNHRKDILDAHLLIRELRTNRILNPADHLDFSIESVLNTLLHLLRYERINNTTPSFYFNPWQLSLTRIFPGIEFSRLTNISNIFQAPSLRIIFVRHPFERLASAYKERIAVLPKDRIEPQPFYNNIRKGICFQFVPTFRDESFWAKSIRCDDYIPSFEQFIRYIFIFGDVPSSFARMDGHWKPYSIICQACKFRYNFIGKYETFEDDFNLLLRRLNIPDWNIQKRRGSSGFNRTDYQRLYLNIPRDLLCRLQNLYREDLILFQYRIEDYLNRTIEYC